MFALIDTDNYNVLAKHADWEMLCNLGVIICPEAQHVLPIDKKEFDKYNIFELECLFLSLTLDTPLHNGDKELLIALLIEALNKSTSCLLDKKSLDSQVDFALKYGIEGFCSYDHGKSTPDLEENKWQFPIVEFDENKQKEFLKQRDNII